VSKNITTNEHLKGVGMPVDETEEIPPLGCGKIVRHFVCDPIPESRIKLQEYVMVPSSSVIIDNSSSISHLSERRAMINHTQPLPQHTSDVELGLGSSVSGSRLIRPASKKGSTGPLYVSVNSVHPNSDSEV
jgi:hypothetical protein